MKEATEFWLILTAAAGALITAVWRTWKNLRRLSRMVDEFLGYEDEHGHHYPGLSERVGLLEEEVADLRRLLAIAMSAQGIDPEQVP